MYCCNHSFRKTKGFTLIELLIAIAIVAILAGIALPSFSNQIVRSQMRTAQADLVALGLNLDNQYQRSLAYIDYPALGKDVATRADLEAIFTGWRPATDAAKFDFQIVTDASIDTAVKAPVGYRIEAVGVTGSRLAGCTIRLDSNGPRATSGCPFGNGEWI